ncbi:Lead, cadmium, zinc and mercury-transporting ATPase [Brevundimonas diminuta]|jgi:Cd2+/Zn2+-exporting ATPase|uniref:P-type Zn(2+) transporter n=6 Tax=Brevundimonas TaxID=41275 RepID=A0A246KG60_BREDI|nr:heavy metal translocating P-type ATPase [Brevundimonas diminuta]OJU53421.1 MAG: ATPase [Brevundimonas sp. 67-6]EGF94597.1 cadmium-translocating P-type ATPase [Brevundimonas diminuta ATCC 11568]OWR21699.1 heavy metal translocating P-type ATPase [Brevundimonas diminuta]SPU43863.1 Lead, cadmium, zinc and mercury-transporting ATPase [Brevundimonas diminuta]SPU47913.1 Lead, cadmium, zinc and mercury-transporting ATPase [Brevundimonas diminuta]
MENLESRYRVTGMDCASCGSKVDAAVRKLPGVTDVAVAVSSGVLKVQHGADFAGEGVLRQVRNLGYGVEVLAPLQPSAGSTMAPPGDDHRAASGPWWWTRKAKLTAACGVALVAAYIFGALFPAMERGAFLVALAVGLAPVGWRAITAARYGTPFSIEMLMTIAAVGAVFIGAAEEAAAVVLLFLVGEMLEGVAAGRARKSIQGLTDLVPKTALVEIDGQVSEVPAESLALGAVILVRPGDRVPADGDVVEGEGEIDEAPVTGESVPKRKMAGDPVFAGTINVGGVLRVRVTAAAADNTIARVVRLVEEAQESKSPTERFIDRFSTIYTPVVLVFGALVATVPPLMFGGAWSEWIYKGLAVLLIGCPCALVISTPAAIAAGLSAGARRGLLMKGGAVLETLGKITAVAFDKTGTLTSGKPIVTDIVADARTEGEVLSMAAALETGSSHPLALAILNRAKADGVSIPAASSARAIPGEGVEGTVSGAQVFLGSPQAVARRVGLSASQDAAIAGFNAEGKTVSVVVIDGQSAGFLAMRDEARPDATAGLARLEAMKIRAIMLTGDNRRTAEAVANGLGVEVRAELLPQDKQRIVKELQSEGLVVAKVGDGINDAPALAAADIGIAMGGGADVALETADAAVLHGRVQDVPDMIDLSRGVMGNIRQNITIALGLKAVFLVTTVIGVTGLWPAILADTGATVLVTANAMRLLRWRPK